MNLLAALAPDLPTATGVAAGKAYVILGGTLLGIDRVSVATGADRPSYSGPHNRHRLTVQVGRPGRVGCCGLHRRYPARPTT